jgi:hypothetical protein
MAVKETIYPATGIYQRRLTQAELILGSEGLTDDAGLVRLLSQYAENPLGELTAREGDAIGFIRDYALQDMEGAEESIDRKNPLELRIDVQLHVDLSRKRFQTEYKQKTTEEKRRDIRRKLIRIEKVSDALIILNCASMIRSKRNEGKFDQAIAQALEFGRALERFRARDSEHKAWTGGKALLGASEGGRARRKSRNEYRHIVAKFRASNMSQRRFVGCHRGISRSTLQRALSQTKKLDSNPAN